MTARRSRPRSMRAFFMKRGDPWHSGNGPARRRRTPTRTARSTGPRAAPSAVDDCARMMARLAEWRDDVSGTIATGGTATAYTLASNQVFDNFADMNGAMIAFVPHTTNGATVTLNVDGLGEAAADGLSMELQSGVLDPGHAQWRCTRFGRGAWYLRGGFANPYGIRGPIGLSAAPAFVLPFGQAIAYHLCDAVFRRRTRRSEAATGSTTFTRYLRGRSLASTTWAALRRAGLMSRAGIFRTNGVGRDGGGQNQTLTQRRSCLPFPRPLPGRSRPGVPTKATSSREVWGTSLIPPVASARKSLAAPAPLVQPRELTPAGTMTALGSGHSHPIMPPTMALPYILRVI